MPCAVMLAFALLITGFPCELVHNFVFISVFRFDFGGFFLFITNEGNRVLWLAKVDWNSLECSLLCWGTKFKGVSNCCLALALLMGGLMPKHVQRTHRVGTSQTPFSSWGALFTSREPATQAVTDGRDTPALILIPVMCCMLRWMLLGGQVGLGTGMCPLLRSASS